MNEPKRPAILIVDDLPENLDPLVEALGDEYDVAAALDGPTALELATSQPPDCILLDILMPGMDGYEVCHRLKAHPQTADIPIILLTVLSESGNKINGFSLGAVDYVTKPYNIREIKARIQTHIRLKTAKEHLKEQHAQLLEAARLREDVERITHHDLKGPLGAIVSLPQLIRLPGNLTPQQNTQLDAIEQAGYTMLNTVNMSLSLLKMERGRYELSPSLVDLAQVLRQVLHDMHGKRDARHLTVSIVLDGRTPQHTEAVWIVGEELLCHSLITSLLTHAFDHAPEKSLVTIMLGRDTRAHLRIRHGGATTAEEAAHFFEKYATASGGVSIYAARLMARAMGGELDIRAEHSQSTTLETWLPLPEEQTT